MGRTLDPGSLQVSATHLDATWLPDRRRARLQAWWLRLHAPGAGLYAGVAERWTDGANFHPGDLAEPRIAAAAAEDGGRALRVAWEGGGQEVYSPDELWRAAYEFDPADAVRPEPWDAATPLPRFEHARVMGDDDALLELLGEFLRSGLVFIHGAPRRDDEIERVAARLSTLQRSHLGDTFTLRTRESSGHLGETADRIPLHIDMVYKQAPPDLQMLHALETADSGGENVFVDAFSVLARMDPADVALLREVPVWFVAESETVHFRGLHPVVAADGRGRPRGIFYNEYKMDFPVDAPGELYAALGRLRRIAADPALERVVRLERDAMVLFHNLRTLHGRRAFQGGRRHLVGCYLSEDDLKSRYRVLARRAAALAAP